ncbi:MAG: TIGR04282 family arsenosugar biosynthesis glycosyltransferase [Acidobacteriota bacterium]
MEARSPESPGAEAPTLPRLILFTKPAVPGRVKTRLIGALDARQTAALHQAFLDDLLERLAGGAFELRIAWALEGDEVVPASPAPGERQEGADLGERLFRALSRGAAEGRPVAAIGSDHPGLGRGDVEAAFAALESADVALGPVADGGYYLIALRPEVVSPRLFGDIPWSTGEVFALTLERCRAAGLEVAILPPGSDVDTPEDLDRLVAAIAAGRIVGPRIEALLQSWGRGDRR